jgi:hypothetical protein
MNDLPIELLIKIFAFVDSKIRRKLFLVSTDFGNIVDRYCFSKEVIPFVPLAKFLQQFKSVAFDDSDTFVVYSISYDWRRWSYGLHGLIYAS